MCFLYRLLARLVRGSSAQMQNTRSFHMWCVATTVAPGQRRIFALGAASLSFYLIGLQMTLLTIVLQESSHPSCGAHTDCAQGNFCLAWDPRRRAPRCDDCFRLREHPELNATSCTKAWPTSYLADPTRWVTGFERTLADGCLAWQHCQALDSFPLECDHLKFKMDRLHWTAGLVLILLSFLMTQPLAEDMDEAAVEEALLDHQLRLGGHSPVVLVAAEILRASLRIRSFFLPMVISAAAVAVIVTGSYSSSDILLNLLAVSFVTEIDNMVSSVFLSPGAHESVDALIETVGAPIVLPWLEVRVRALMCVVCIAFGSLKMPELIGFFYGVGGGIDAYLCSHIIYVVTISPLLVAVAFGCLLRPISSLVMGGAAPPAEATLRRCRQAGRQLWLSFIAICAGSAFACWGIWFIAPGNRTYFVGALALTILAATFIAIEVTVRVQCAAPAKKPSPHAVTTTAGGADATTSATVASPEDTVVVACEVGAVGGELAMEVARLRDEMLRLVRAEMTALKVESTRVREQMSALEAEVAALRKDPAREGEEVAAIEVKLVRGSRQA